LITYVAERNFSESVKKLKERVEKGIHECSATFTGEFLLIVSGYTESDWEAHISVLRMEPLK